MSEEPAEYNVLQEAQAVVGSIEVEENLGIIAELMMKYPNGSYLFLIADSSLDEATTIEVGTNTSSIEGLGLCKTYEFVTMNGMWGGVEEDIDAESQQE